ncbi:MULTISPECIES: MFS transporter [Cytobacillus]|jgi:MFS family permease|uniref:MFS transporter n=1 Tax=Cytobacillus oceanisediminis 2691 TaxID=1196031 RepID=A0A160MBC9_9BACI|nr:MULTISPECIES: MFS transporter [Cytobacillus]EFV76161.1 antibiotic resistance protein [Bacillus sp. 2_A_57_CT2]MCS0825958.1 MFS transporter [Cytobacillus firmus]AND40189.1 MFS transporter [Cytobacillus oceanisediminis 2691]MCM3392430.1 MFS transporter [Cytobacillus oceanisediminis]MCM3530812.1 MFS transporter [Cytobacillus oceanisediminis]
MAQTIAKKQNAGSEKIWSRDFVLILMSNFFIFLGFQMTLPTIPLFVEKLGGNDQLIGIVVGIFTFSALLLRPYAGHMLETKGRRFVYLTGLAIFVLSVGSFGFVNSLIFLFVLRIVQGFGWGFSTTASGTIATDLIPAKRRGEGMGYFGLSGNIALAFGPTLGLALAGVISFKLLFLICALLGLAALVLSSRINYKQAEKQSVPLKRWDIYEKSALRPSFLLFFITVTFGGIASFLPIYSAQKGIGGIHWYFLLFAIALMISRTFAGRLYDQRGHQAVFLPGAVLILAAMFLLAWLPNSMIMYIAAIFYGLGFGSVQPALQAWSVKEAPANRRGMANATFFSFFDLGVGIGAMVFGQIAHLFGYSSIYMTAAGSVGISILLYIWILITKRG